MLAFEISINNCEPITVTTDDVVCINLSYGVNPKRNSDLAMIFGADDAFFYTWHDERVQNGDKILIRVVDVDAHNLTIPQRVRKKNRERMKQEFERLKIELQNKQLL